MLLNITIQILQFMPKQQVLLEEKGLKSKGNEAPQNSILCNNPGHGELSFPVQPVLSGSWALPLCLAGDLWQGSGDCPQLPTGNLPRSSPRKPWEGSSLLPRRKYLPFLFSPFYSVFLWSRDWKRETEPSASIVCVRFTRTLRDKKTEKRSPNGTLILGVLCSTTPHICGHPGNKHNRYSIEGWWLAYTGPLEKVFLTTYQY